MSTETSYVLTHHKCASTWLLKYVEEYCRINSLVMTGSHISNVLPEGASDAVVLINASYAFLRDRIPFGIHVIRNPLDIVVSAFYSHRDTHSLHGWPELSVQRNILRLVAHTDGMQLTIAFLERDDFYKNTGGPLHALRHWDFSDERFLTLRMEDVVRDPDGVVGPTLRDRHPERRLPPANAFAFESMAGRKIGQIDASSHYRSGERDQWRVVLPPAAQAYVRGQFEGLATRFYPDSL